MIEFESQPSVRLFSGEKVLKSELCAQAKSLNKCLEFTGEIVGQYILPFDGEEDILFWVIKRETL